MTRSGDDGDSRAVSTSPHRPFSLPRLSLSAVESYLGLAVNQTVAGKQPKCYMIYASPAPKTLRRKPMIATRRKYKEKFASWVLLLHPRERTGRERGRERAESGW